MSPTPKTCVHFDAETGKCKTIPGKCGYRGEGRICTCSGICGDLGNRQYEPPMIYLRELARRELLG